MRNLTIIIPGAPVPKGRPKFSRRGGFPVAYTPAQTMNYESLVKSVAYEGCKGEIPMQGAVQVYIVLYYSRPKSLPKKKAYHVVKPDVDNVAKSILDGMGGVVFRSDSQVVRLTVEKRYSAEAERAEVTVQEVA